MTQYTTVHNISGSLWQKAVQQSGGLALDFGVLGAAEVIPLYHKVPTNCCKLHLMNDIMNFRSNAVIVR